MSSVSLWAPRSLTWYDKTESSSSNQRISRAAPLLVKYYIVSIHRWLTLSPMQPGTAVTARLVWERAVSRRVFCERIGRLTRGDMLQDMSRGRISCAFHTKGYVAGIGFLKCSHGGSCCRDMPWFRFLIGLFSEVSREHVAWTVTRGDLACNRGVTLFCCRDMSPQFKLTWIQGTCRGDKISSPQQDFSWKSSVHTMGFVAGTFPATCPLAWADLIGCASVLVRDRGYSLSKSDLTHSASDTTTQPTHIWASRELMACSTDWNSRDFVE